MEKEKLYNLKGEQDALNFAINELEKDSKIIKYLKLVEKKKELDTLISDMELDIKLDKMRNCKPHLFVGIEDFHDELSKESFNTLYCIHCGLYNPNIYYRHGVSGDEKSEKIEGIYRDAVQEFFVTGDKTKADNFYLTIKYSQLETLKKLYYKLNEIFPNIEHKYIREFIYEYLIFEEYYNVKLPLEICSDMIKEGYDSRVRMYIGEHLDKYFKGEEKVLVKKKCPHWE